VSGTVVETVDEWQCNLSYLPEVNFVDTSISVPLNSGLQALVRANRSGTTAAELTSLAIMISVNAVPPTVLTCLVPEGKQPRCCAVPATLEHTTHAECRVRARRDWQEVNNARCLRWLAIF
jgi:hypothetical protein